MCIFIGPQRIDANEKMVAYRVVGQLTGSVAEVAWLFALSSSFKVAA